MTYNLQQKYNRCDQNIITGANLNLETREETTTVMKTSLSCATSIELLRFKINYFSVIFAGLFFTQMFLSL